jgi:thiosulfate/3-mercaptopyruvate sulfurtransferase
VAVAERQRVRAAVERGNAQVFDARTRAEYTGQDLRKNTRGGHIPGAINIPHKELLDEHGRLRSPGALAALFEQAGFKRGQPVITHCDGGGRASLAALAAERAGYGPVLNYYLSFGDWAADASCPVVQTKD